MARRQKALMVPTSALNLASMPGHRIFTATGVCVPRSVALWTCPMEATPRGTSSQAERDTDKKTF